MYVYVKREREKVRGWDSVFRSEVTGKDYNCMSVSLLQSVRPTVRYVITVSSGALIAHRSTGNRLRNECSAAGQVLRREL